VLRERVLLLDQRELKVGVLLEESPGDGQTDDAATDDGNIHLFHFLLRLGGAGVSARNSRGRGVLLQNGPTANKEFAG